MGVKETLDKIVERHPDVIGAMVLYNGNVQHNLEAPYDVISADTILETVSEIMEQTSILKDEDHEFREMILDFPTHSFMVRAIDNGVLAVLSTHLQRGQLVKLHVGLGIFGKSVQKAIDEELASGSSPTEAEVQIAPEVISPVETHEPIAAAVERASDASEPVTDESSLGFGFIKRRGGFRGTKELLASRVAQAAEEKSQPAPEEPKVNADGVPLNPDGTPKKKKLYRGAVYYE